MCSQLLWVSTQTHPDVAYATCFASTAVTRGTICIADLKMVNKTVKFLEKNPLTLRFKKLLLTKSVFVVFCDASFGNLKDGSFQGSFIIFLVSLTGKCCLRGRVERSGEYVKYIDSKKLGNDRSR